MMVGRICIWLVVIVSLAHLLEASRITTRGNLTFWTTPVDVDKVCGVTSITDFNKWSDRHFPWMAAIFSVGLTSNVSCGGALISQRYLLTAAQCVVDKTTGLKKSASDFNLRLGDIFIFFDFIPEPVYKVVKVVPHPEYDPPTYKNDIALLKLDKAVQMDYTNIAPVCLPTWDTSKNSGNRKAFTAGWEMTKNGQYETHLTYLQVDMVSKDECQKAFDKVNITISDSQLCAASAGHFGGPNGACHGDEGGPLIVSNADGHAAVIGIISNVQCGQQGLVDIYTNVTSYLNWIKNAQIE